LQVEISEEAFQSNHRIKQVKKHVDLTISDNFTRAVFQAESIFVCQDLSQRMKKHDSAGAWGAIEFILVICG